MIAISPGRSLLCLALLVFCPTVGLEIAHGAAQAPEGFEGWHIPDSAAAEHNPEPLDPATLGRGQRYAPVEPQTQSAARRRERRRARSPR